MNFSTSLQTQFKCTYRFCGRALRRVAIAPESAGSNWFFVCPVCAHKSALVNLGGDGLPDRFLQPDVDEHGRQILDRHGFS